MSGRGGRAGYQEEYRGDESFETQDEMGQGWGNGGRGRPRGGPPRGGSIQITPSVQPHAHAHTLHPSNQHEFEHVISHRWCRKKGASANS